MALMALLPSWLGLLGGWSWLLDLFSHFRWQYLVASGVVVALAAWRRAWWIMAAAGLTLGLNGLLIGGLAWQPDVRRASLAPGFDLEVVSLNVQRVNSRKQDVLAYLQSADADVIFLMEVDAQWLAALQPLAAEYPHRFEHPRSDNFGLALFSRAPMTGTRLLVLADSVVPTLSTRITHQGREVVLVGAHPVPPLGRRAAALRNGQLASLALQVAATDQPVLVLGDLNTTPWSHGMRLLTSGDLGFRGTSPPWQPTWRARSVFAMPIDHALCTPPLVIAALEVGPDVGSDHRPLAIRVGWST